MAPETWPLELRLFGPPSVLIHGQTLSYKDKKLSVKKSLWLLALLALREGQKVERSWLAGMLWSNSNQSQALYNLRRHLSDLRFALGNQTERIVSQPISTLSLDLSDAFFDVVEFDRNINSQNMDLLKETIELYRGPLLEGCTEEWVYQERAPREKAYLNVLETLTTQALEHENFRDAEQWSRRLISEDPYREGAYRLLMQTLAGKGDYAAIMQAYRDLRNFLYRELNANPSAETTKLYERLCKEARSSNAISHLRRDTHLHATPICRIPRLPDEIVDRDREMEEVERLLRTSRLVTLTGTGGVGKTVLAKRIGVMLAADYPDGAWFADLTALVDPALVPQTVASSLDIHEEPGLSIWQVLHKSLHTKDLLLVLDNCEHLLDACPQLVVYLLENCPNLHILTTSRQSLRVSGEIVRKVPSLSVPDAKVLTYSEKDLLSTITQFGAVQLFLIRARQRNPQFVITPQNVKAIAEVCIHLDGIPLAIELAAARLQALTVEEITLRLKDRFRLLTGGDRTKPKRYKTLRATVDWSYDLLTEGERILFHRLSVFAGGWRLEAAENVCTDETKTGEVEKERAGNIGIETWDVLDVLTSLVDKSLVIAEEQEGSTRYRLLETVRQYTAEKLKESGEAEPMRNSHRNYFLALAEEAEPYLTGPDQVKWFDKVEREQDNFREALTYCQEKRETRLGLRLIGGLGHFWKVRGYLTEGRSYIQKLLALNEAHEPTAELAKVLIVDSDLAYRLGDRVAAESSIQECMEICHHLDDQKGIANALIIWATLAREAGDYERACQRLKESRAIWRELPDFREYTRTLQDEAIIARIQGDLKKVRRLLRWALTIRRKIPDRRDLAATFQELGNLARIGGDFTAARAYYNDSLEIRRDLGDLDDSLWTLEYFAFLAIDQALWERGARLLGAATRLREYLRTQMPRFHKDEYAQYIDKIDLDKFAGAWIEGYNMELSNAIAYSLATE